MSVEEANILFDTIDDSNDGFIQKPEMVVFILSLLEDEKIEMMENEELNWKKNKLIFMK